MSARQPILSLYIRTIETGDLRAFTQCHFFAGIGERPYALRLAGCPDPRPAWAGSCPCQPFCQHAPGYGQVEEEQTRRCSCGQPFAKGYRFCPESSQKRDRERKWAKRRSRSAGTPASLPSDALARAKITSRRGDSLPISGPRPKREDG